MQRKLLVFALLLFTPLVFAECPYLDVSLVDNAHAQTNVQAVYPITLTNTGINAQFDSLAASCDAPLQCSFAQAPYATLYPTQHATFQLLVKSPVAGTFQIPLSITSGTNNNCDSRILSLVVTASQQNLSGNDFDFTFEPVQNQSTRPGEDLTYYLKAANNKDAKIYVRMSSEGFFNSVTQFQYSDFEVAAHDSKRIAITVKVPPGTPSNIFQESFNARVTTNDGVQYYYSFPTQIFVYSNQLRLALQNEPSQCTLVKHNDQAQIDLRVRNDGEITGPFDIELNAGQQVSGILDVSPKLLEVKQGDTQDVLISINPKPSTILDYYAYQFVLSYNGIPVFLRDYCFQVFAKTTFVVNAAPDYAVGKGQVGVLLPFTVWNNGTVAQDFAVEVAPPSDLLVKIQPSSFTLGPGEKTSVNLVVTPSMSMREGKIKLPAVVRTSNVSQAVTFNLTILPPGQTVSGQGIQFKQESVRAYAGVETKLFVALANTNDQDLHDVTLTLAGIPGSWYTAQAINIPAHTIQGVPVTFNIPVQQPAAQSIQAHVDSAEGVSADQKMTLYIEYAQAKLEFDVQQTQETQGAGGKSLYVTINVRNTGQKPLYDIRPVLPTGYVFALQPESLFLQPGQSAQVTVRIDNPSSASIPLKLKSQEGVESDQILVKATPTQQSFPWVWIAIAVVAILAAMFIFFKRQQEHYA